jgi:hypothetical protein
MSDSKLVSLPPHLWEALELMSTEMGVPGDALIAQAVFTLARLNGYVISGKAGGSAPVAPPTTSRTGALPKIAPVRTRAATPPPPEPEPEEEPDAGPEPELPPDEEDGNPFDAISQEAPGGAGVEDYQDDPPAPEPEQEPEPEPIAPPPVARVTKAVLSLFVAGRDPFKMTGDSFTIGRGKSCDFVIDSNRVSREHVRILREGSEFVLEDLNSSNGTFYGPAKEKITRRKIKDGDEFTLGTEKIRFQIRK